MSDGTTNLPGIAPDARITQSQLAELLKITPKTVRQWKEKQVLPRPYRLGTLDFWTPEQISSWLASQNLPDNYLNNTKTL